MLTAKNLLQDFLDETQRKKASHGEISGISSGFVYLDRVTHGWQSENLIFVGCASGMGSSALLNNFAVNALKMHPKSKIAFYSALSSKFEWINSLIANEAKIDSTRLRRGDLGEDDMDRLMYGARMLNQIGDRLFHNSKMPLTVDEIREECLILKAKDRIDFIIIDGFESLIGADKVLQLKHLAKEFSIPVICSVSLNEAKINSRPDKRPKISDLPINERFEKIADLIMFIYRDEYYNPDSPDVGKAEIIFAKNRYGETGKTHLAWLPTFNSFHNMLEEDEIKNR